MSLSIVVNMLKCAVLEYYLLVQIPKYPSSWYVKCYTYFYLMSALSQWKYTISKEKRTLASSKNRALSGATNLATSTTQSRKGSSCFVPAAVLRQLLALLHPLAGAQHLIERLKRAGHATWRAGASSPTLRARISTSLHLLRGNFTKEETFKHPPLFFIHY